MLSTSSFLDPPSGSVHTNTTSSPIFDENDSPESSLIDEFNQIRNNVIDWNEAFENTHAGPSHKWDIPSELNRELDWSELGLNLLNFRSYDQIEDFRGVDIHGIGVELDEEVARVDEIMRNIQQEEAEEVEYNWRMADEDLRKKEEERKKQEEKRMKLAYEKAQEEDRKQREETKNVRDILAQDLKNKEELLGNSKSIGQGMPKMSLNVPNKIKKVKKFYHPTFNDFFGPSTSQSSAISIDNQAQCQGLSSLDDLQHFSGTEAAGKALRSKNSHL